MNFDELEKKKKKDQLERENKENGVTRKTVQLMQTIGDAVHTINNHVYEWVDEQIACICHLVKRPT